MDVSQLHFCLRLFLHRGKPQELFLGSLNIFLSIVEELQSQKKIVGTLTPPSVPPLDVTQRSLGALRDIQKTAARETKFHPTVFFLIVARLLILPMWFIVVNSPNLAHQHWEGERKQWSVPTILKETIHVAGLKNKQLWYLIYQLYKSIIFNTTM